MDHRKKIATLLEANAGTRRLSEVFDNFVELSALTLRNAVDKQDQHAWQVREDRYLNIARTYDHDQLDRFAAALAHVSLAMQDDPTDVLGQLYMELDLGNDRVGQFFSPTSVATFMASLTFASITEQINQRGRAELFEPACGAGAFVIAMVDLMAKSGLNPYTQLFITAEDISPQAVHMAYVHFCVLGVPAVVHHRDTLSYTTYDSWPTGALLHRDRPGSTHTSP